MANPKRKHSKSRTRKKRALQVLHLPSFVSCPRCGQPMLPHKVCGNCEHYKDEEYALKRPEKAAK